MEVHRRLIPGSKSMAVVAAGFATMLAFAAYAGNAGARLQAERQASTEGGPLLADIWHLYPYQPTQFSPIDMAYTAKNQLLMVDGNEVRALDPDRPGHVPWPAQAPGGLWKPVMIRTDVARGLVYVVDDLTERVQVFTFDGAWVRTLNPEMIVPDGDEPLIEGLAIAPDGEVLILARRQDLDRWIWFTVHRYASNGMKLATWSPRQFGGIRCDCRRRSAGKIEVDGDGRVILYASYMWFGVEGLNCTASWQDSFARYTAEGSLIDLWRPEVPDALLNRYSGMPCPYQVPSNDYWSMSRADDGMLVVHWPRFFLTYDPNGALVSWRSYYPVNNRNRDPGQVVDTYGSQLDRLALAIRPEGGLSLFSQTTWFDPSASVRTDANTLGLTHVKAIETYTGRHAWSSMVVTSAGPGGNVEAESLLSDRVAVAPDGLVYTLSAHQGVVSVWDPDGKFASAWLTAPASRDVASTSRGEVVVHGGDAEGTVLYLHDRSGTRIWRADCDCDFGTGLFVDDPHVFVANRYSLNIARYDLADGSFVDRVSPPAAHTLWPVDLAAGAAGDTFTALDMRLRRVERWRMPEPGAAPLPEVPDEQWKASGTRLPLAVTVAEDGMTALAMDSGEIQVHSATGDLLATWRPEAEGYPAIPVDLAFGPGGRLYVLDGRFAPSIGRLPRLLVYEWSGTAPTPTVATTPTEAAATPTPGLGSCVVSGQLSVDRSRVKAGDPVTVQQVFGAACPPEGMAPVDVMLLLDGGCADPDACWLPAIQSAALAFVDALDLSRAQVGLVAGSSDSEVCITEQLLTSDKRRIAAAIRRVRTGCSLVKADGLDRLSGEFRDGGRPGTAQVVVVFTSGGLEVEQPWIYASRLEYAARMAARGTDIHVLEIAAGSKSLAKRFASRPEFYQLAPTEADLVALAASLGRIIRSYALVDLLLENVIHEDADYVPGSALPRAGILGRTLQYGLAVAPAEGVTLTYQIVPRVGGRYPPNAWSLAHYTDGDRVRRLYTFEQPILDVDGPTRTPSPSPSPIPSHTPSPSPSPPAPAVPGTLYLPVVLRELCVPDQRRVDVVLVIDTSGSMTEPTDAGRTKLEAARAAAQTFVDTLRLERGDQAAIVAFNADGRLLAPLTGDRAALALALDGLTTAPETCIVCGIDVAARELGGPRHASDHTAALVLLTDGRSGPRPIDEAVTRAAAAKAEGITIYTIGLGDDVEAEALRTIASTPRGYYQAPDGEPLAEIYRQIAVEIPCPRRAFWGG